MQNGTRIASRDKNRKPDQESQTGPEKGFGYKPGSDRYRVVTGLQMTRAKPAGTGGGRAERPEKVRLKYQKNLPAKPRERVGDGLRTDCNAG